MRLPAGDSELVQIMDGALAEAARRAGEWLVCRPGCTPCCHGAFAIGPLDALRLSAGMEALRAAEPLKAEASKSGRGRGLPSMGRIFPAIGDRNPGRDGGGAGAV